MSQVLEQLILEFDGDFSRLDAAMAKAEVKAEGLAAKIERTMQISVDDSALDRLLKKLDKLNNQRDIDIDATLNVTGDNNPKTPNNNGGGSSAAKPDYEVVKAINALGNKIDNLGALKSPTYVTVNVNQERIASSIRSAMQANTRAIQSGTFATTSILGAIKSNTRRSNPVASLLKGVIGSTVGASLKGTFEGFGQQLSRNITKQTARTEKGQQAKQVFDQASAQAGIIGIQSMESYSDLLLGGSKKTGAALQDLADDLITVTEFLSDPAVFIARTEKLKNYVQKVYTEVKGGGVGAGAAAKEVGMDLLDNAPRQTKNAIFRGMQVGAIPAKQTKINETLKQAQVIKEFGNDFDKVMRLLDTTGLQDAIRDATKVLIVSGGFERKNGDNSQATGEALRPFLDDDTAIVSVKNTFTDRYKGDPQSKIYNAIKEPLTAMGIDVGGEIRSLFSNLEVLIDSAFKGTNNDGVKMAVMVEALKKIFPDKQFSLAGFSGGGIPTEIAIALREALGDTETRGVGIGTPMYGLTNTADSSQFRAVLGKLDPQAFAVNKEYTGYSEEEESLIARQLEKKGNDMGEYSNMGMIQPPEAQAMVSGHIKHDLHNYIGNDEAYQAIQEFIPGMAKLGESVDFSTIDSDIVSKHQEIIDIIEGNLIDPILNNQLLRTAIVWDAKVNKTFAPEQQGGVEEMQRIADIPVDERTPREKEKLSNYVATVFEGITEGVRDIDKSAKGAFAASAKADAARIKEENPELELSAKQIAKQLKALYTDLLQISPIYQRANERRANTRPQAEKVIGQESKRILSERGVDAEGMDDLAIAGLASFISKRESDDMKLLRGLDLYKNKGTSDIDEDYEIFNFDNPIEKVKIEMKGFKEYVTAPIAKALRGSEFEQIAADYNNYFNALHVALTRFVATGEEVPQAIVDAGYEIFQAKDKLASITLPENMFAEIGTSTSPYDDDLVSGARKLNKYKEDGQPTELSRDDIAELVRINKNIIKDNKKNNTNNPLVNIKDAKVLGRGMMGRAVIDPENERVVKIGLDLIGGMADDLAKAAPYLQGLVNFLKPEQATTEETNAAFAKEVEGMQMSIDAGLAKNYTGAQVEGTIMMPLVEGKGITKGADALLENDVDAIKTFIGDLIENGRMMAEFHKAGLTHGDLHGDNLLKDSEGNYTPIDFGKTEKLPTDTKERNLAIKDDFEASVRGTVGILVDDKEIDVNPNLIKSALKAGLQETGATAEDIYNAFVGKLLKQQPIREEDVAAKNAAEDVKPVVNPSLSELIQATVPTSEDVQQAYQTELLNASVAIKEAVDALNQDNSARLDANKAVLEANTSVIADAVEGLGTTMYVVGDRANDYTQSGNMATLDANTIISEKLDLINTSIATIGDFTQQKQSDSSALVTQTTGDNIPFIQTEVMSPEKGMASKVLGLLGKSALQSAKQLYQVAYTADQVAVTLIPFGREIKRVTQFLAPIAGAGAAAALLPGGTEIASAVLEGASTLVSPLSGAVGDAVAGGVSGAVADVIGFLPGSSAAAGAIGAAAGGAAEVATTAGALGAGALVANNAIQETVKAALEPVQTEMKQLEAGSEEAATKLLLAGNALRTFTKGYETVKAEVVGLEPSKKQLGLPEGRIAREDQIHILEAQVLEANSALIAAKDDKDATRKIVQMKGVLMNMLKSRMKKAGKEGLDIKPANLSLPAYRGDHQPDDASVLPLLEAKVIKQVDAGKDEANNFIDGFNNQVDARVDELESVTEDLGNSAIDGFKTGTDSHSPSKKMEQEGDNFTDGFINQVQANAGDVAGVAEDLGNEATEAFNPELSLRDAIMGRGGNDSGAINFDPIIDAASSAAEKAINKFKDVKKRIGESLNNAAQSTISATQQNENRGTNTNRNTAIDAVEAETSDDINNRINEIRARIQENIASINGTLEEVHTALEDGITGETDASSTDSLVGEVADQIEANLDDAQETLESHNETLEAADVTSEVDLQSPLEALQERVAERLEAIGDWINGAFNDDSASPEAASDENPTMETTTGETIGRGAAHMQQLTNGLLSSMNDATPNINEFFAGIQEGFQDVSENSDLAFSQLAALGTGGTLLVFKDSILDSLTNLREVAQEVETIRKKLFSIDFKGDFLSEMRADAKNAGSDILSFADNYVDIVGSLQDTVLNPEQIFKGLATGLGKRGVVGESLDGSLTALSQMAGKGVVSMEELRQQLGDRLPRAVKISADAMGLTTKEMFKLVGSGRLLASDFLPALEKELNNVSVPQGISLNKELTEFSNIKTEIDIRKADAIPFAEFMMVINKSLSAVLPLIPPMIAGLQVLAVAGLANLAVHAGKAALQMKLFQQVSLASLKTGGIAIGVMALSAAIMDLSKSFRNTSDIKKATKALEDYRNTAKGITEIGSKSNTFRSDSGILNFINDNANSEEMTVGSVLKRAISVNFEDGAEASIKAEKDRLNKAIENQIDGTDLTYIDATVRLDPEAIADVQREIAPLQAEKVELNAKINNSGLLGIEPKDRLLLQEEVGKLTEEIDATIEATIGLEEISLAASQLQQTFDAVNKRIADGNASESDFTVLDSLKQRLEVMKELERTAKRITLQMSDYADALDNITLVTEVNEFNSALDDAKGLNEEYTRLLATGERMESLSAFNDMDAVGGAETAIANLNAELEATIGFLNTMDAGQRATLAEGLGTDDIMNATREQLVSMRLQIEETEENDDFVDPQITEYLNALTRVSDIGAEQVDADNELKKANFDLMNAIRDLQESFLSVQIGSLDQKIAIEEFAQRLLTEGTGFDNQELADSRTGVIEDKFAKREEIRSQSRAFRNLVESVEDASSGFKNAVFSMANEIQSIDFGIISRGLNSTSSYLSAAGLEDKLGLSKLNDLAAERVQINQNNDIEATTRDRNSNKKDFGRQRRGLNEEAGDLGRQIASLIRGEQDKINNNQRTINRTQSETELSPLRLQRDILSLQDGIAAFKRTVETTRQQAAQYGIETPNFDTNFESIHTITENSSMEDVEMAKQYLVDDLNRLNAMGRQHVATLSQINASGQADFRSALGDLNSAFRDSDNMFSQKITAQKREKASALSALNDKEAATVEGILNNLTGMFFEFKNQAQTTVNDVNGMLDAVGMGTRGGDFIANLRKETELSLDSQLNKIEQEKRQLDTILDIAGKGGDDANAKIDIQRSIRDNGDLDSETKNRLLAQYQRITTTEEYQQALEEVTNTIAVLEKQENRLKGSSSEYINKVVDLQKAKFELEEFSANANLQSGVVDAQLASPTLSEADARKLKFKKDMIDLTRQEREEIAGLEAAALDNPLINDLDLQNQINEATKKYAQLLANARSEASLMTQIMLDIKGSATSAVAGMLTGIGDALTNNNAKQEESSKLDRDYADRLSKLTEEYAGNAEGMMKAKAELDKNRDSVQNDIDSQLSTTANVFNVLKETLSGFASAIADVAAQMAAQAAIGGIFSLFGGGSGIVGGLIGGANNGGTVGSGALVNNFANGGTVGLGEAMSVAMTKEGNGAIPIVAHKGEQVLTTKNKDAQFYRSLKQSGIWDEMKTNSVANFANGGTVGTGSLVRGSSRGLGSNQSSVYYNTNVTVVSPNASSFNRTRDQIAKREQALQSKSSRRGLSG